ncbi:ribose 5-phosphate isomerase A [Candidatus Kinetoplastibacterium crithidii (ex Angomonas deanei ATCC 30255)]|nr:ribose 5-phosphate isomerase A [Candidatus Kinetoplastibacterium crithidii (ex Angomonas deanei ATCC 30255)]
MYKKYHFKKNIIGVGTGSTVDYFIEELSSFKENFLGAVASSKRTELLLSRHGIKLFDLNELTELEVYIDGADEVDYSLSMIKGGGGALTREKIIASSAKEFICIADESKLSENNLGKFPLPVEVIPMAISVVSRYFRDLGGNPILRKDFVTDNGNYILDIHNFKIGNPVEMEKDINNIPGVVTCGLFAIRGADKLILATLNNGIKYFAK